MIAATMRMPPVYTAYMTAVLLQGQTCIPKWSYTVGTSSGLGCNLEIFSDSSDMPERSKADTGYQ